MSEGQAASALERMYEDTNVRDEIVDTDAKILLQWGETQVNRLAQKEMEDSVFEDAYYKLTKVMGRINRFVGMRQDADDAQKAELLEKLVATAADAGYPISAEAVATFAQENAAMDNAAAIRALTAMIDTTSTGTPPPAQTGSPTPSATTPEPPSKPNSPLDSVINWIKSSQGKE
jgi:hypothetical protein